MAIVLLHYKPACTSAESSSFHTVLAVIMAIISHKFKAMDLHKLNPLNHDKETAYTFNGEMNQFEVSHCSAKEYKMPFLVIIPLQAYFDILAFHMN
ncbi:hypothetical protein C0993_008379 [Termitomyces sp. T159_Od127]|nr:hypothetical protein C0993_008379 [Termitomyces sp. T159_Od127]